jgi:hypothetical protein
VEFELELDNFEVEVNDRTVVVNDSGFKVVVDPQYRVDADIILITDGEHLESYKEEIESICDSSTCLIIPDSYTGEVDCADVERISAPDTLDIFNVEIVPVTYEDTNGYRFVMADHSFFVQGTQLYTSGLKDVGKVDTAFLFIEPDNVSEIVKTGVFLKPGEIVPYGFKEFDSVEADIRSLKADLEDRNLPFNTSFLE